MGTSSVNEKIEKIVPKWEIWTHETLIPASEGIASGRDLSAPHHLKELLGQLIFKALAEVSSHSDFCSWKMLKMRHSWVWSKQIYRFKMIHADRTTRSIWMDWMKKTKKGHKCGGFIDLWCPSAYAATLCLEVDDTITIAIHLLQQIQNHSIS